MTCKIESAISTGVYIVRDQFGRKYRAQSGETYIVGDWVTILDGVIVGKTGVSQESKIYEV
jgi:hypothetical protein